MADWSVMRFVQALTQITKPAVEECVRVNALPICLCEYQKANVRNKVTCAFGLVDFHASLNVCQRKNKCILSLFEHKCVSFCVCEWWQLGRQWDTVLRTRADLVLWYVCKCREVCVCVCVPQDYRQLSRRKISKRCISKFSNYITMRRCNTQIKLSNIHPEQAYAFDL